MSVTKIVNPISVEQARIDKWEQQKAKESPSFSFEQSIDPNANGDKKVHLRTTLEKKDISSAQRIQLYMANYCAISGSGSFEVGHMLLEQTMKGFFSDEDYAQVANAINSALLAMAPADIIEGQLCARLLVLNNQIAEYMGRAASPTQTPEGRDLNINRATKLMRVYNESLEALNRHRRGSQTLTVQNVNVNSGGQAIVAGQFNPGESNDKK